MPDSKRRIIRKPELCSKLGISDSTFNRRYRWLKTFPEPLNLPDGKLGWFEHEIDRYLDALGRTNDPTANVTPLPAHWWKDRDPTEVTGPQAA